MDRTYPSVVAVPIPPPPPAAPGVEETLELIAQAVEQRLDRQERDEWEAMERNLAQMQQFRREFVMSVLRENQDAVIEHLLQEDQNSSLIGLDYLDDTTPSQYTSYDDMATYETASEMSSYMTAPDVSSYMTAPDVSSYMTAPDVSSYMTAPDVSSYMTAPDVSSYMTAPDMSSYMTAPESYVTGPDMSSCSVAPEMSSSNGNGADASIGLISEPSSLFLLDFSDLPDSQDEDSWDLLMDQVDQMNVPSPRGRCPG